MTLCHGSVRQHNAHDRHLRTRCIHSRCIRSRRIAGRRELSVRRNSGPWPTLSSKNSTHTYADALLRRSGSCVLRGDCPKNSSATYVGSIGHMSVRSNVRQPTSRSTTSKDWLTVLTSTQSLLLARNDLFGEHGFPARQTRPSQNLFTKNSPQLLAAVAASALSQ